MVLKKEKVLRKVLISYGKKSLFDCLKKIIQIEK